MHNLFQKTEEGTCSNSFYEGNSPWYKNQSKTIQKKKRTLQTNILHEYRHITNKISANSIQQCRKEATYPNQVRSISGMQGSFTICKSINVIYHINWLKKKNHMIISKDAKKASDKTQNPFMIKTCRKLGMWGYFINLILIQPDEVHLQENLQLTACIMMRNSKLSCCDQEQCNDVLSHHCFST